jgi:DNA-binding beta-propeller fold protein YncE
LTTDSERRGYLKLSPDGTKLAIANQRFDFRNNATVYNFDNATGTVSANGTKVITDTSNGQAYGVEFSADSKKLYISTVSGYRNSLDNSPVNYQLFQFDLTAADIPGSKALIHEQIGG